MREIDLRVLFLVRSLARLPGGRASAGLIIAAVLLSLFWSTGVFSGQSVGGRAGSTGAALFFSAFLAYIIPIFGYIIERTWSTLDQLRDAVDVEHFEHWNSQVHMKKQSWLVSVLLVGTACGLVHNLLLFGSPGELIRLAAGSTAVAAVVAGTQMTWIIVTVAFAALIDNALLLNRLARRSHIEPFCPEKLRPFATIAVISTLALIGAQAVFPVMFVDDQLSVVSYLPGLLATGVPMVLLAVLPVWPVHRRLAAAKQRLLTEVNQSISRLPAPHPSRPESVQALVSLLAYRREIRAISEWPFDVGVLARLALFLFIPPLTWVGAALVENLVNAFL